MSALPAEPPRYSPWTRMLDPLRRGSSGWGVYGLQRALGVKPADGVFGPGTERVLKKWQKAHGLLNDGVAGPKTQGLILKQAGAKADRAHGLPEGVGYGFAVAEGGAVLAATNWNAPGGVDCGPGQFRIGGPPFKMDDLRRAFRPFQSIDAACDSLVEKQAEYMAGNPALRADPQTALAVAVVHHNWRVAADQIARDYRPGYDWWRTVTAPAALMTWGGPSELWPKKADGSPYTRSEWVQFYAGSVLRFVV